ncbi:hypothetical protein HPP92_029083, partial [Vanilla planifolia]
LSGLENSHRQLADDSPPDETERASCFSALINSPGAAIFQAAFSAGSQESPVQPATMKPCRPTKLFCFSDMAARGGSLQREVAHTYREELYVISRLKTS